MTKSFYTLFYIKNCTFIMHKSRIVIMFYFFILVSLSGCGSVFSSSVINSNYFDVSLSSTPTGAYYAVYDDNGKLISKYHKSNNTGITPARITLIKNDIYSIRLDMAGYPSQTVKLKKDKFNFAILGNLIPIGVGAILTGNSDSGTRNYGVVFLSLGGALTIFDILKGNVMRYQTEINIDFTKRPPISQTVFNDESKQNTEHSLYSALQQIIERVEQNATLAVIPITTTNTTFRDYITGETEYILVNKGFNVVDRVSLNRIRTEQKMQTSGEIDDRTAASIGRFLGANYIVIGRIVTTDIQRLRLQMLDVQTTDVVGSVLLPIGDTEFLTNSISIEDAIPLAIRDAITKVPPKSRLAIVDVSANPYNDFIRGEAEYNLFEQGYTVIDRSQLDNIRKEVAIQYSGEVDDNTAVSIGKLAGADYLISIRSDGQGGLTRLRWRILDTQTARVAGVASIPYEGIGAKPGLPSLKEALVNAIEQATSHLNKEFRIAIAQITMANNTDREYLFNESEFVLINSGFRVVDRSQLDRIRHEQRYQLSEEVDDNTAIEIGKFAGARYIMTGRVDGIDYLRRLRLRILDTQTAEVVGVSSTRY